MKKTTLGLLVFLILLMASILAFAEEAGSVVMEEPILTETQEEIAATPETASAEAELSYPSQSETPAPSAGAAAAQADIVEEPAEVVIEETIVEEIVVVWEPMAEQSTAPAEEPEAESTETQEPEESTSTQDESKEGIQKPEAFTANVTVEVLPESELVEQTVFQMKAHIAQASGAYTLRWEQHDPLTDKPDEDPVWKKLGTEPTLELTAELRLNALDFRLVVTGADGTELTVAIPHLNVQPLPIKETVAETETETEPEFESKPEEETIPESGTEADEPATQAVESDETIEPVETVEAVEETEIEVVEEEPVEAAETAETPAREPRRVTVRSSLGNSIVCGAPIRLTAELQGFDHDEEVTVIWEIDDGAGWREAATGETFEYTASLETLSWNIRARVLYTP